MTILDLVIAALTGFVVGAVGVLVQVAPRLYREFRRHGLDNHLCGRGCCR